MNYKIIGGDQREYGPIASEQLRQWVAEGRANGQSMVQPEGATGWLPLASFPDLASALAAAPGPGPVPASTPATISPLPGTPRADVPNYLVWAILTTVCCCLPLGIPAIVYAAQVNTKLAGGDMAGAQKASQSARMWCWISLAGGAVTTLLYLAFMSFGLAARLH